MNQSITQKKRKNTEWRVSSEGFSLGSLVFLPPQKVTLLNSNSIWTSIRDTSLFAHGYYMLSCLNKVFIIINTLLLLLAVVGQFRASDSFIKKIAVPFQDIFPVKKDNVFPSNASVASMLPSFVFEKKKIDIHPALSWEKSHGKVLRIRQPNERKVEN